jgi:hypothetical protein
MSFLRRFKGGRGPEWASFMSGDEFRAFIAHVEAEQRRRGSTFRIEDDGLYVDQPSGPPQVFGLSNLAQLCHQLSREEWPEAIAAHFRNLDEAAAEDARMEDPEVARPFLKVRVYRRSDLPPESLEVMVMRPLTTELVAALVLDLPTTVRTLNQDALARWPEPMDSLFQIGLEHLAAEATTYQPQYLDLDGETTIEGFIADSFFVASQVVRVGDLLGGAPNGALVSLPNRHSLYWHRLADAGAAVRAVQGMLSLGHQLYQQGPGSLTPELHWWHGGALTPLPSSVTRGKMDFFPPDAFMEVLNALPSKER